MKRQRDYQNMGLAGMVLGMTLMMMSCSGKKKEGMEGDQKAMEGSEKKEQMEAKDQRITVKGSDTMVELAQVWAEEYMKFKSQMVMIQVTGGGSGTGFAALLNRSTDIVNASREIQFDEKEVLKVRDHNVMEYRVAQDGVSIYVHNSNPVNELTMKDLMNIYSGQMKNWNDFGGKDEEIVVYGRENSSGTYKFFKKKVLKGKDYHVETIELPGTASIVNAVSKDMKGIGYGGIGTVEGVKLIKLKMDKESMGYEPNKESVINMKYPLSRYLYLYTTDKILEAKPYVKNYINWMLSSRGQDMIDKSGYFKLTKGMMKDDMKGDMKDSDMDHNMGDKKEGEMMNKKMDN